MVDSGNLIPFLMNLFQTTFGLLVAATALTFSGCNAPAETKADVSATFDANAATVLHLFSDFESEDEHFFTHFAEDAFWGGTSLNAPDSIPLSTVAPKYRELWGKYDYKMLGEPNFLPGVNPNSKETDGSVRGYFKWNITKPATDSTGEKSVDVKIYESFDFNAEGKIDWTQVYANMQAAYAALED